MRYKEKKFWSRFYKKQKQVTVRVYNDMVEFEAVRIVDDREDLGAVLLSKEEWLEAKKYIEDAWEK